MLAFSGMKTLSEGVKAQAERVIGRPILVSYANLHALPPRDFLCEAEWLLAKAKQGKIKSHRARQYASRVPKGKPSASATDTPFRRSQNLY
jgi:hypothetical protein